MHFAHVRLVYVLILFFLEGESGAICAPSSSPMLQTKKAHLSISPVTESTLKPKTAYRLAAMLFVQSPPPAATLNPPHSFGAEL